MGKLLDTLGKGYRHTTISYDALLDPQRLAEYDVVFLTCSGVPRAWVGPRVRDSVRGGPGVFNARPEIVEGLRTSLRRFVGHGGTLYVSDLHFKLLEVAFPEFIDQDKVAEGETQTIQARVADSGLEKRLGPSVELRFEMRTWRPAAFRGPEVTIYLEGAIETIRRGQMLAPLLVSFPFQEGSVIFTSFHNEAQQTDMERELLRYLVFTTVTAREDARIKRTMVRGGVSPQQRSLLSASEGGKAITETYQCSGATQLQFVLGFQEQGARLRLSVVDPDGKKYRKTGTRTVTIRVDNPGPGQWEYTIDPLEVPYRNFPFTLTIGEKG
jgi:hypothetical protein